jgi:hypothetical protein
MEDEALLRYPYSGGHDGLPCVCTRDCPAACDGDRADAPACERAWIDSGLDELIATKWKEWQREK